MINNIFSMLYMTLEIKLILKHVQVNFKEHFLNLNATVFKIFSAIKKAWKHTLDDLTVPWVEYLNLMVKLLQVNYFAGHNRRCVVITNEWNNGTKGEWKPSSSQTPMHPARESTYSLSLFPGNTSIDVYR